MRRVYDSESTISYDPITKAQIRQITTANAIHHHPFFLVPAYDSAGQWLFFVSHRTGHPQIFAEERSTQRIIQLTNITNLSEWSIHPSLDGKYVYYTTSEAGFRVEMYTQKIQKLVDFEGLSSQEAGMVAGGMGTTALSDCGSYWTVRLSHKEGVRLLIINTSDLTAKTLTEHDSIAHMQFCPDDPELLFFAGNFKERLWTIRIDGSGKKPHYQRQPGQWITHESWIPGTQELSFVDWPHAVRALDVHRGTVRNIVIFNAWHAIANDAGTKMVADTNSPDIGIHTFPIHASTTPELICKSEASSAGEHWHGPFPYERGPIEVYAPQHTHPHPRFAPGDSHIVFTSDRSGTAQLYEVCLPPPNEY